MSVGRELHPALSGTRLQFLFHRLPLMGDAKQKALLKAKKTFWTTAFFVPAITPTEINPDQRT